MKCIRFWLCPGFLGCEYDFSQLKMNLVTNLKSDLSIDYSYIDYTKYFHAPMNNAAQIFLRDFSNVASPPGCLNFFVGYSMGGRFGYHVIDAETSDADSSAADEVRVDSSRARDNKFDGYFIIAGNYGLDSDEEKVTRLMADTIWAEKFEKSDWQTTLIEWNNQAVFKNGKAEPKRFRENYNEKYFSNSLVNWSVAKQENFFTNGKFQKWSNSGKKVCFISGEHDQKFTLLGNQLSDLCDVIAIASSGHRVLFDNSEELARQVHCQIDKWTSVATACSNNDKA